MKSSHRLLTYSACMVLSLGAIPSVFAYQNASARENDQSAAKELKEQAKEAAAQARDEAKANRELAREQDKAARDAEKLQRTTEREAAKTEKLDAKKLELCEKKESKVTESMQRVSNQGLNQLDVFKKIADRTVAFYEAQDHTVDNYQALLDDVNAKYLSAKESVETISTATTFDCSSDNPKLVLHAFRDAHKAKTAALKEYKTAVKDLIVAVKSAQGNSVGAQDETEAKPEPVEVEAR